MSSQFLNKINSISTDASGSSSAAYNTQTGSVSSDITTTDWRNQSRTTINESTNIGYMSNRRRKKYSLIDRPTIRTAMLPQEEAKKKISFNPDGYYDDQTDIREIDRYVKEYFSKQRIEIPEIDTQIVRLQNKLDTEKMKMISRLSIEKEIKLLETKKKEILSEEQLNEYIERVSPVLEEWELMCQGEGPNHRFGEEKKFLPDKLRLVRICIQIASDYAPLGLSIRPVNKSGLCLYCRNPYSNEEEGKLICEDCGIYQDPLMNDMTFSDLSRVNGANTNDYTNRENFVKTMDNYQGKGKVEFPTDLFTDVDEYCTLNRKNKMNLTVETTRIIFKQLGYSAYYEHINLFLFMYIGRKLPDISMEESDLLEDYDVFTQVFNDIKGDKRGSALNSQYLLYILMRRRKIQCERHEFKLPDTPSIKLANDNMARRVFNILDWTFEDTA